MKKRIAFYGGTFDPVHNGHMAVAEGISKRFGLDEFHFVPAFHAPHKPENRPTSAFHRYSMLALATASRSGLYVSPLEVEQPSRPYTIETLARLWEIYPEDRLMFVIGADSWEEITTWREWERLLTSVDIAVVTRPGYELRTEHVTDKAREIIIDARGENPFDGQTEGTRIYFTDVAFVDVSATRIRTAVADGENAWRDMVPPEVAEYIDKYEIYRGRCGGRPKV
ncbi:MAG: nicotinate-nucleotide adenylyltransferase [Pyrinomonadaceae bacterium]